MFENRSGLAFRPDDALNMVSPASDKHHDDRVASRIGEFGTGLEMVVENDDARRQLSFQRITTIFKMMMRSNLPTEQAAHEDAKQPIGMAVPFSCARLLMTCAGAHSQWRLLEKKLASSDSQVVFRAALDRCLLS